MNREEQVAGQRTAEAEGRLPLPGVLGLLHGRLDQVVRRAPRVGDVF